METTELRNTGTGITGTSARAGLGRACATTIETIRDRGTTGSAVLAAAPSFTTSPWPMSDDRQAKQVDLHHPRPPVPTG